LLVLLTVLLLDCVTLVVLLFVAVASPVEAAAIPAASFEL
jgi:hypothetical protein